MKKLPSFIVSVLAVTGAFSSAPTQVAAGNNPYIGDIIAVGQNFCPRGWANANGQLLSIASNTAMFSLLGTTYGGDGSTTFGLPDLRGRAAMGQGRGPGLTSRREGQKFGNVTTTLTTLNLPSHHHSVNATNADGDQGGPGGKLLAAQVSGHETIYSDQPATRTMSAEMIANEGRGQPFYIQDPFLAVTYCIATIGIYPSRP